MNLPLSKTFRPMNIAVDAHNVLTDRRGIGVYVRSLLADWSERPNVRITLVLRGPLVQRYRRRLTEMLPYTVGMALASRIPSNADVSWHPWNGTFFANTVVPAVATLHDVVPFAFPAADGRVREHAQRPFLRTARTAGRIITDSEFSRGEIRRYLAIPEERIKVIALAADERYSPGAAQRLASPLPVGEYLLFVGAADERKNFPTLYRAWRSAFPDAEVALVCVGGIVADGVVSLGNLRVEDLRDAYRGALALVMPSLYEGFGIPPLEAMRCGTPCLVSRAASLPEVCGEAACYVDDPCDETAWMNALRRLAADEPLRRELRERGFVHVQKFSWKTCAERTLDVLASV